MKRTNSAKCLGEAVVSQMNKKARDVYNMSDWLFVYGYQMNIGSKDVKLTDEELRDIEQLSKYSHQSECEVMEGYSVSRYDIVSMNDEVLHCATYRETEQYLADMYESIVMLSIDEFIDEAIDNDIIDNDDKNVWVTVQGEQHSITVIDVLGREEQEPFEAAYALEEDRNHEAWESLYEQYTESF